MPRAPLVGVPWKPGVSGNPGGRPKAVRDVAKAARAHTKEALAVLVEVMSDADAPPSARVSAAVHILDRGYGKPAQSLSVKGDGGGNPLAAESTALLMRFLGHLEASRQPGGTVASERPALDVTPKTPELAEKRDEPPPEGSGSPDTLSKD